MSDTENKTENNAEKTEAAPYMKKASTDNKTESKKSNFIIPVVLLLVSAIVIVATFYEDEYNALMTAQSDETTETAQPEMQVSNPTAETIAETNTVATADTATEAATAKTTTTETAEVTNVPTAAPKAEATNTAKSDKQPQVVAQMVNTQVAPAATAQAKTAQLQPNAQFRSNNANRYNGYNREQATVRAKQHMAMIQQRRQTYDQEMQTRRTQYEAAMKAQQERRSNMIEAQKAAYQRAHKNKVETGQKLQLIYKKIDGLHQEIDQIMREYHSTRRSSTAPMHTL